MPPLYPSLNQFTFSYERFEYFSTYAILNRRHPCVQSVNIIHITQWTNLNSTTNIMKL